MEGGAKQNGKGWELALGGCSAALASFGLSKTSRHHGRSPRALPTTRMDGETDALGQVGSELQTPHILPHMLPV